MHAFEKHFFARMKSVFMESTHQIHTKVIVNLDPVQIPEKDVLLFACKHPIFEGENAHTQTIIASKICTPSGSVFLFLPPGEYWIYWVNIEEDATEADIHLSYTNIYKTPSEVFEIGNFKAFKG